MTLRGARSAPLGPCGGSSSSAMGGPAEGHPGAPLPWRSRMAAIEERRAGWAGPEDRWTPRPHARAELRRGLLAGGVAGLEVTHPLDNVLWKIERLCGGDPDVQLGITGLAGAFTPWKVLGHVAEASGFDPDPSARWGPVAIDPDRV